MYGYKEFPEDVKFHFKKIIETYSFREEMADRTEVHLISEVL